MQFRGQSERALCTPTALVSAARGRILNLLRVALSTCFSRAAPPCVLPKEDKPEPVVDTENTRGSTLGYLYDHAVFHLFKVRCGTAVRNGTAW